MRICLAVPKLFHCVQIKRETDGRTAKRTDIRRFQYELFKVANAPRKGSVRFPQSKQLRTQ
jgi:hypothetical protein